MDEREVADLVDLYLAGRNAEQDETSSDSAARLHRPAREVLERFRLELGQREAIPPDADLSLQAVWARIQARRISPPVIKPQRSTWQPWTVSVAIVAALVLVIGLGAWWRHDGMFIGRAPAQGHVQRYITTNAQHAVIQLPDGSSVQLGSASELMLSPGFNQMDRTVTVHGEAYFQVTDRSTLPFLVRSGNAVTRVLGTEFSVRKYPEDTAVSIIVVSGKVAVGATAAHGPPGDAARAVLTRGDDANVDAQGTVQISHAANLGQAMAWTHGTLVFDNTPFREVIPELERQYDLTIQVTDSSILDRHVTTQFTSESASDAVQLLASILNVSVVQHGQQVRFSGFLSKR